VHVKSAEALKVVESLAEGESLAPKADEDSEPIEAPVGFNYAPDEKATFATLLRTSLETEIQQDSTLSRDFVVKEVTSVEVKQAQVAYTTQAPAEENDGRTVLIAALVAAAVTGTVFAFCCFAAWFVFARKGQGKVPPWGSSVAVANPNGSNYGPTGPRFISNDYDASSYDPRFTELRNFPMQGLYQQQAAVSEGKVFPENGADVAVGMPVPASGPYVPNRVDVHSFYDPATMALPNALANGPQAHHPRGNLDLGGNLQRSTSTGGKKKKKSRTDRAPSDSNRVPNQMSQSSSFQHSRALSQANRGGSHQPADYGAGRMRQL
jgi:hypothetical protein